MANSSPINFLNPQNCGGLIRLRFIHPLDTKYYDMAKILESRWNKIESDVYENDKIYKEKEKKKVNTRRRSTRTNPPPKKKQKVISQFMTNQRSLVISLLRIIR